MNKMTTAAEFAGMTTPEVRDFIRECRSQYRAEKSRRHMAKAENLRLIENQHETAMSVLRGRP